MCPSLALTQLTDSGSTPTLHFQSNFNPREQPYTFIPPSFSEQPCRTHIYAKKRVGLFPDLRLYASNVIVNHWAVGTILCVMQCSYCSSQIDHPGRIYRVSTVWINLHCIRTILTQTPRSHSGTGPSITTNSIMNERDYQVLMELLVTSSISTMISTGGESKNLAKVLGNDLKQ